MNSATQSGDALLRYVAVEGPIGVGKTSLAKRLAEEFGAEPLLEGVDNNPFLPRFYQNQRQVALSTQLHFLLQRVRQIQELRQGDMFTQVTIADFLLEKDYLFAEVTLDKDEFALYEQVYDHLSVDAPVPDLVVYLQAPVSVLLDRIGSRGRNFERAIDAAYLRRINEAYADFFHRYDDAPLLIVNAADIDLVNSDADYRALLAQIRGSPSGRHFFNPLPFV